MMSQLLSIRCVGLFVWLVCVLHCLVCSCTSFIITNKTLASTSASLTYRVLSLNILATASAFNTEADVRAKNLISRPSWGRVGASSSLKAKANVTKPMAWQNFGLQAEAKGWANAKNFVSRPGVEATTLASRPDKAEILALKPRLGINHVSQVFLYLTGS